MKNESEIAAKEHLGAIAEKSLYVLAPIEQQAIHHRYQPFMYKAPGFRLYISGEACKFLRETAEQKIRMLHSLIEKDKISKNIPLHLREVFDDPQIVLSLPPRLRNRLCTLECYCLFTIMQRGRSYFATKQNFSPGHLKTLDGLFANYHCGDLF